MRYINDIAVKKKTGHPSSMNFHILIVSVWIIFKIQIHEIVEQHYHLVTTDQL
jgi:hypothetical protein